MKLLVFCAAVLMLAICCSAYSGQYYYYGDSGQIMLPMATNRVSIKISPEFSFSDWSELAVLFDALIDTVLPQDGVFGYDIYCVEQGTDIDSLLDTLNGHYAVSEALPLFQDSNGFVLLPNDQLVVKWIDSVSQGTIDSLESIYSINLLNQTERGLMVYETTDSSPMNSIELANLLYESSLTYYSHPDFASKIQDFDPNDPNFQFQYYLENNDYSQIDIDARKAWDISMGDSNVIVAVIDDGIQSFHEDLDSSKFIYGWDFVGYGYIKPDSGPDNNPSPAPNFFNAHGMCVSGIISGDINNSKGNSGIAPKCKLMRLKIYGDIGETGPIFDTISPWALPSVVAMAIEYADENGADVINGSFSWPNGFSFWSITEAVIFAVYDGVTCVFSSGNDGTQIGYPANLAEYGTVAVGACRKDGTRWQPSNSGIDLSVVAPAWGISSNGEVYTNDIVGLGGYNPTYYACPSTTSDYMCNFGATSAAAPQVAAIAALILSRRPDYRNLEFGGYTIGEIIRKSAVDSVGDPNFDTPGWDNYYGYGVTNAFRALLAVSRCDVDNDGSINPTVLDLTYYVNWLFKGGPAAVPDPRMGDCNCDGMTNPNVVDLTYIVNKIFRGGPSPVSPCYKY